MNKNGILAFLGVVIIGGGAFVAYYFLTKDTPAPAPVEPVAVVTPSASPSPSGAPGERIAQLKPVGNVAGDGTAVRSLSNGRFVVKVSALLPEPPAGKFYEAYLERITPPSQFAIGKLTKQGNDWVVTLDQTRDASAYTTVFISLESTDDKKSEQRLLTGSF
jgi:hypothetical protein